MQGQVFKIHSDFFYVNTKKGILECKLREVLKKQKQNVLVGDFVALENITKNETQAFISNVLPRSNFINKPKVANITQAIIVSSLKEPDLDFEQLNRYIAQCEFYHIKPVLCFNKNDLIDEHEIIGKIESIYKPLGYELIFASALMNKGIKTLSSILKGNTSILCGLSGVGKSSIINMLSPDINIKTKQVSDKTKRGVHTTRHCEIMPIFDDSFVVDTPGFSNLKFDFLMPNLVQDFFPEVKDLSEGCKFNNCLHKNEAGCNVLNNLDKIDDSRYKSYIQLVDEALEYKNKITYSGNKTESTVKETQNKMMTKISSKKRVSSRKINKQSIDKHFDQDE